MPTVVVSKTLNFLIHSACNLSSRQMAVKLTRYKTPVLISHIYNLLNGHGRKLSWPVWRCYPNTCWQRPNKTAKILGQDNLPQLKSELSSSRTQVKSATLEPTRSEAGAYNQWDKDDRMLWHKMKTESIGSLLQLTPPPHVWGKNS